MPLSGTLPEFHYGPHALLDATPTLPTYVPGTTGGYTSYVSTESLPEFLRRVAGVVAISGTIGDGGAMRGIEIGMAVAEGPLADDVRRAAAAAARSVTDIDRVRAFRAPGSPQSGDGVLCAAAEWHAGGARRLASSASLGHQGSGARQVGQARAAARTLV